MAIAAIPAYLGRDFSRASPGLRFGMYLPLWGVDSRSNQPLWTTHDLNQRTAGARRELREFKDENKTEALARVLALTQDDIAVMKALAARQAACALALESESSVLTLDAIATAPFTTGLGNEHPLENGFAFLNPYGLPYLPASGVKGVLRQAARELAEGEWGDSKGWSDERTLINVVGKERIEFSVIDALFGLEGEGGDKTHQRGALMFWDVLPQLTGDSLQVEVMTPHQSHYYQEQRNDKSGGSTNPHDSGQPNPITFLTIPPGSRFAFHVQCDVPFLARLAPALAEAGRWQVLLQAAFEHAFAWLGFGAKTAVGYGAMEADREAAQQRARDEASRREREAERAAKAAREAAKQGMSAADRAMADLFDQRVDKNQDERAVLFNALKAGKLAEFKAEAAQRVKLLMEQQRRWREKSDKKNPDKDHLFQETLQVRKWLDS